MTPKDRIDVIQQHISVLRTENSTRGQTLGAIWRFILVGFAAVVTLGEKVNLDFLWFALPTLLMTLVAYWLGETAFLVRTARCIAKEEVRINEIAGIPLLTYETEMWEWRRRKIGKNLGTYILIPLPIIVGYFYVVTYIKDSSPLLQDRRTLTLYWFFTLVSFTSAFFNYARYQLELHPEWDDLRVISTLRNKLWRSRVSRVKQITIAPTEIIANPGPESSNVKTVKQTPLRRVVLAAAYMIFGLLLTIAGGRSLAEEVVPLPEFFVAHRLAIGGVVGIYLTLRGLLVLGRLIRSRRSRVPLPMRTT